MSVTLVNDGTSTTGLTTSAGSGYQAINSPPTVLGAVSYAAATGASVGGSVGGSSSQGCAIASRLSGFSTSSTHRQYVGLQTQNDLTDDHYYIQYFFTASHLRDYAEVHKVIATVDTRLTPAANEFADVANQRVYFKRGKLTTLDVVMFRWVENELQLWMHDDDEADGMPIAKWIDASITTPGYCGIYLGTDSNGTWDDVYTGTFNIKWMDDSGNNANAGTKGAPWGTLRYALANMDAGGVLISRTASYSQSVRDGQDGYKKGTDWYNPSVFQNYNNETVVNANTSGVPSFNFGGGAIRNMANAYLVFWNIEADGQNAHPEPGFMFNTGCSKIRLVGCRSRRHGVTGGTNSVGFQETFHNDPDDGGRLTNYDVLYIYCAASENAGSHGFYITRSGTTVEFSIIYDNGGMGISWQPLPHLGQEHGQNGKIRNNRIWGNGYRSTIGQAGIYIAYQIGLQCYNNLVYHNHEAGILLGGFTDSDGNNGVLIYHNVCWKNGQTGKSSSLKYGIYGHGDASGGGASPINNQIKNNIVAGNWSDTIFLPAHFDGSNVRASNYFADPGFVNPDHANRLLADFNLSTVNDPVVDAGSPTSTGSNPMSDVVRVDFFGFPRPSLDGYDIGAVEWSAPAAASSNPTISGPSSMTGTMNENIALSIFEIQNTNDPGNYVLKVAIHAGAGNNGV